MAPITAWNPATKVARGNISIGLATAVADISAPKLTEINTGTGLECALTNMNGSSSSDSQAIDWLCDPASEQIPGSVTHSMDDLLIKATGQADATLVTALKIGDVVYVWRRDGVDRKTAPAVGDFIWVWKVVITSIDPAEATNAYIAINAHVSVLARSKTAIALVA